ncbi:MAG: hypothetical protein P8X95_25495 [Anaerolineales bacterium]
MKGLMAQEAFHERAYGVILGGIKKNMEMVGHQAVCRYPCTVSFQISFEQSYEVRVILFIEENGSLVYSTIVDVVVMIS